MSTSITLNRLNTTMTAAQVAGAKLGITSAAANMPFLIGLTKAELINLPKINVSNKAFVEDAINIGVNNPSIFPPWVVTDNIRTDLILFEQLDELELMLMQLLTKVQHTRFLTGSEAYTTALMIYKLTGNAADAGMPGMAAAYQQLRERFANSAPAGDDAAEGETPGTGTEAPGADS